MTGVLVNVGTVLLGSTVGLLFRKGLPERLREAILWAIGLCTAAIGIMGIAGGGDMLVMILSLVLGTAAGTLLHLEDGIGRLGQWVERKAGKGDGSGSITRGFMTASLLFCVGSMTIVGCLEAGFQGSMGMLYTKSLLDLISSMVLAASLGVGVLFAAGFVLVFQGALVLLAGVLSPLLSEGMILAITCVGSVSILGLGLNLLGLTKIRIADQLPALLFAPLLYAAFQALGIG